MKYGNIDSPNIIDTTCEVVHDKVVLAAAANTTLLIHGAGPNNATTFYDNSSTARTLTTAGNTKFDSSQYKFRVSSIKFDGTTDYITAPDSADWAFGTGNFTIDCWVRFNSVTDTDLYGQRVDVNNGWRVRSTGSVIIFAYMVAGTWTILFRAPFVPSAGVWYHIALVRMDTADAASSWGFFIDGVRQTLTQLGTTYSGSINDFAADLTVGGTAEQGYINGWIDEFRLSKGIARWTSDFTPPTAPYDSPLTQYVIDGLDGNIDKEYRLIMHVIGYGGNDIRFRFNNDTGNNYGQQRVSGVGASTDSGRLTGYPSWLSWAGVGSGYSNLYDLEIYAKAGVQRTGLMKSLEYTTGTTVYNANLVGLTWNNSTDNITSFVMKTDGGTGDGFGAGTRFIFLKKRELTTGTKTGEIDPIGTTYGHWQLIYDNTLTSAATSVTISGLDGDNDVVYRMLIRTVFGAAATSVIQLNGDTGSNYGAQYLNGVSASVSASRDNPTNGIYVAGGTVSSGNLCWSDLLLYVKSGFLRTSIMNHSEDISGTTINAQRLTGADWNNTADNITSIVYKGGVANSLGIGTHIELWRLNL